MLVKVYPAKAMGVAPPGRAEGMTENSAGTIAVFGDEITGFLRDGFIEGVVEVKIDEHGDIERERARCGLACPDHPIAAVDDFGVKRDRQVLLGPRILSDQIVPDGALAVQKPLLRDIDR